MMFRNIILGDKWKSLEQGKNRSRKISWIGVIVISMREEGVSVWVVAKELVRKD